MISEHKHSLRCQPRLQTNAQNSVQIDATDINTEPGYRRAMDTEMLPKTTRAKTSPWIWVASQTS